MHSPPRSRSRAVPLIERLESRCMLSGRVVGYFPEYRWSFFNRIDWDTVTHLNYFSISANSDGSLSTANVNLSHLATAVATAHARGDTISITVGPHSFSTLAGSAAATNTFVNNVVNFAQTYNLDGIDIDWEPRPTGSNITRFGNLIDALHARTSVNNLKLTIAAFPNHQHVPLAAALKLDWINIMAYNFSYADHTTYGDSINSLIGWNTFGVPRDKLVLGIPFYGRQGTSWTDTSTRIYRSIIEDHRVATGSYPSPDANLVNGWYINGVNTVRQKTQYVVNNGYGGVMIWELGQDHHDPQGNTTSMSLLPAIKSVIHADPIPPAVTSADFLFATAPHRLRFAFSEDVSASLQPSDLVVRDVDTNASIIVSAVTWDGATNAATFTLNSIVPDGRYRATLSGSGVMDPAGNPLGSDYLHDFVFLNGDANRDGRVNLDDFNILAANFGQSGRDFTQGDFSYDGIVNLADFNILAARFGVSVAPQSFGATVIVRSRADERPLETLREDLLA